MSACNNFENYWQNLNLVWQKHYWITDKVRQWSDLGLIKSNRQVEGMIMKMMTVTVMMLIMILMMIILPGNHDDDY